jgi:hypothetical protein
MSLRQWVNNGWLKAHQISPKEIQDLLKIVERDLADAVVGDLSADWRFGIAYNAALKLCTILITAWEKGHHGLIKTMTDKCQPYLPLGDVVLPLPDPPPELVEQTLKRINFERIQTAMKAVGWTNWSESKAPSIDSLRAMARRLLETVAEEKQDGVELHCGGFRASWYLPNNLVLTFVLESGHASWRPVARLRSLHTTR